MATVTVAVGGASTSSREQLDKHVAAPSSSPSYGPSREAQVEIARVMHFFLGNLRRLDIVQLTVVIVFDILEQNGIIYQKKNSFI